MLVRPNGRIIRFRRIAPLLWSFAQRAPGNAAHVFLELSRILLHEARDGRNLSKFHDVTLHIEAKRSTTRNPGATSHTEASRRAGSSLPVPSFGTDPPRGGYPAPHEGSIRSQKVLRLARLKIFKWRIGR